VDLLEQYVSGICKSELGEEFVRVNKYVKELGSNKFFDEEEND